MPEPARSGGLIRRALLSPVIAIGVMGGLFLLGEQPAARALLGRYGVAPTLEVRVVLAALMGALAGFMVLVAGLRGADRAVGRALELIGPEGSVPAGPGSAGPRIEDLPQILAEWRRHSDMEAAAHLRVDAALGELGAALKAGRFRGAGFEDHDNEALREVVTAIATLVEAHDRQRQVTDALLARVEDDLSAVGGPLQPSARGLEDAVRRVEELRQAWPSLTPLASLRSSLEACRERMHRSGRALELVERELAAVRRRVGGVRVIRLTTDDFVEGREPE